MIFFQHPFYRLTMLMLILLILPGPLTTVAEGFAASGEGKLRSVDDLADKRIGVLMGSLYDKYAHDRYPNAQIQQFQTIPDQLMALKSGKIDAVYYSQVSAPEMFKSNPDLGYLARDVFFIPIGAGFNRDNDPLREQFNRFLLEIRSNGVYDDMVSRWMNGGSLDMPDVRSQNVSGVLRTGVVNDMGMPFALISNGKLIGFDIELGMRFASWLGRAYEPVPLSFGSLIASIATHKIDIITASMAITEERAKMIDFSEPYYDSGAALVARKDALDPSLPESASGQIEKKSFLSRIYESFQSNIVTEKRYLLIIKGLRLTIQITLLAALLGTLIGGLVCAMRMSKRRVLRLTAIVFINLLRGTPVLVLLMVIYYVVFSKVNIDPGLVAVVAFGLNFGAYVSEMFRTSIESIDPGQREAGIAGGFTGYQAFRFIVAPQALRHLLPVYKGEIISLMKMTSVVGYIAVEDLTKASDIIRSRTFDAFFPLLLAAAIYLLLAWALTRLLDAVGPATPSRKKA